MNALLDELSDIKAENGILNEYDQVSKEISSEVYLNVIEGHSSVADDHGGRTGELDESEIAYDNLIENMIEERSCCMRERAEQSLAAGDSHLTIPEASHGQVLAEIVDQSSILHEIDQNSSTSIL